MAVVNRWLMVLKEPLMFCVLVAQGDSGFFVGPISGGWVHVEVCHRFHEPPKTHKKECREVWSFFEYLNAVLVFHKCTRTPGTRFIAELETVRCVVEKNPHVRGTLLGSKDVRFVL